MIGLRRASALSWQVLRSAFARFMAIDGTQRAAAFAYYAFFSLFPLAVLLVTLGSLFVDRETAIRNVIGYAERHVPLEPEMERHVFDTISGLVEARGSVGMAASLMLLWGAAQFFKALVRATNRAWKTDLHSWWQMPLKSIALLAVLASAVVLGIAVPVGVKLAEQVLPALHGFVALAASMALKTAPTLIVFCGVALFYRMAPRRETRFSEVWLSAAFATVLLKLVETLFGLYLKSFGNFNVVYGTFGGVMALLLWIYLSGGVLVLGACLSAAQAERRAPMEHDR